MSQSGSSGSGGIIGGVTTLTGNAGGAISPTAGNIDILGTNPITVTGTPASSLLTITVEDATATQKGVAELATNAETIAGTDSTRIVVPSGLTAKLGTQTQFGACYGDTTSNALAWTAAGTDGQLLIASTGLAPAFASLTSTGSTITVTGGPGTINIDLVTPVIVANGGTGRTSHTAYAVICGGTTTTNPQQSIASVGASGQVLTSNGAAALPTFEDPVSLLAWTEVFTSSATMAVNTGYIADNTGLVTLTLPAVSAVGTRIRIAGRGNGGWRIAQNATNVIHFISGDTTGGPAGSLDSTQRYNAVELLCLVANTEWSVISSAGNIDVI